ncbi:MAG: polyamine aminopropyltransferase [Deltaproteobacteria bacterium]|nr:polyamine aminopropyltransferase [Deltaproteobacteria bacterium]
MSSTEAIGEADALGQTVSDGRDGRDGRDGLASVRAPRRQDLSGPAVLFAVFVIGLCGILYELLASTLASYVLGDSVMQFSTIIGVYLFAMGAGAWLSRFVDRNLVARFIEVEIAVALIGGASSALLFMSFGRVQFFRVILYGLVIVIGTLVGLEIPLLARILQNRYDLKDLLARVLTVDYIGALVASLAFPLVVVPQLGLVRGAFVVGIINALVAFFSTFILARVIEQPRQLWFLRAETSLCLLILLVGCSMSDRLTRWSEDSYYADPVVFSRTTPYQRIIVTRGATGFQLYLNGHLQFSSADEHRYHEALVHPAMAVARSLGGARPVRRVLVLGGGDGLAVREILRHPGVQEVTLVDLDPAMTEVARDLVLFRTQNKDSLRDPRVHIVNDDAMVWLRTTEEARAGGNPGGNPGGSPGAWDVIVADFPDPNSYSLGKLYTTSFYRLASRALAPDGVLVVQATSPLMARRSFWCIAETMEAAGLFVRPYQATVPSFGVWGFVMAARRTFDVPAELVSPLVDDRPYAFVTSETLPGMFAFPADMQPVAAEVNRLNNQVLVQYYETEWAPWK